MGCGCITDRKVGGKEKLLRSKERYHVSRIIFFKILVTVAKTFIHLAALV